ncbi:MAG: glycosyltransferase family 2 protein [Candidatus Micrarchaeia archaeon]
MPKEDYSDTTVIVPVKNEPATAVSGVLSGIFKNLPSCSVIVIYKGKSIAGAGRSGNLTLIRQKSDGKGAACYEAVKYVDTPIMCIIDGDMTYSARDLRKLIAEVRNGADIAIGNRLHNLSTKIMPRYVQFGNRMLTTMLNVLYGTRFKDSQTGLRAMKKGAFESLNMTERRFGFEEEMLIRAKRKNYNVAELPIGYAVREGSSKQLKPLDGIKLMLILFKHLFDSAE